MRFASGTFLKDDWAYAYERYAREAELEREPATERLVSVAPSDVAHDCAEPVPETLRCPVLPCALTMVSRPIQIEESCVDASDGQAA